MGEPDLPVKTVTCHTEGCVNAGVPVALPCCDVVVCGGCGVVITDITA